MAPEFSKMILSNWQYYVTKQEKMGVIKWVFYIEITDKNIPMLCLLFLKNKLLF